jgi:hypothetical protein
MHREMYLCLADFFFFTKNNFKRSVQLCDACSKLFLVKWNFLMNCCFCNVNKPNKRIVREKWKTRGPAKALQSINPDYQWLLHYGNTIFLIELLRDQFIRKDKTPERGFRGLTIISSIVCLKWLVFGLIRKRVCVFAFKICKEKNIPHTFKNETADTGWMYVCNFSDPLKHQRTTNLS